MSRTTITNDNDRNKVTIDINLHELSIIQTSIALTMASMNNLSEKLGKKAENRGEGKSNEKRYGLLMS
jgi:hypothetical protein